MVSIILMLIGGASGSTAGGVKVGTFGLVLYSSFAIAAGRTDVVLYRRRISATDILRAVSLVVICILIVFSFTIVIMQIEGAALSPGEDVSFVTILFEAASAFSTCGLSMGITSILSPASHILLMVLMFLGRIGIFTVTVTAFSKSVEDSSSVRFPVTKMLIG